MNNVHHPYRDRVDAGQALGRALAGHGISSGTIVLALPRGGVPVAFQVARTFELPLDVFLVRKLGVPEHPELAMGAIASGDVRVMNEDVVESWGISEKHIAAVEARELVELHRRERAYRRGREPLDLRDREVLLVDDGLATGASMRAAVVAVKRLGARRVVVAVPVGAPESCAELAAEAGELVCPLQPPDFTGVGRWYDDFSETSDEEVRRCLDDSFAPMPSESGHRDRRA